jgi:hypothetical protein
MSRRGWGWECGLGEGGVEERKKEERGIGKKEKKGAGSKEKEEVTYCAQLENPQAANVKTLFGS